MSQLGTGLNIFNGVSYNTHSHTLKKNVSMLMFYFLFITDQIVLCIKNCNCIVKMKMLF